MNDTHTAHCKLLHNRELLVETN